LTLEKRNDIAGHDGHRTHNALARTRPAKTMPFRKKSWIKLLVSNPKKGWENIIISNTLLVCI
jgi:hypothetical protein